ncbi:MAG: hypothetical protein ACOY45_16940 [Pseudomonadota bacterium]
MIAKGKFWIAGALPLALIACSGGGDSDDGAVNAAAANAVDPALAGALQDQIMVDPTLGQQSNGDAIRPPGKPYTGALPDAGVAAGGTVDTKGLMKAPPPTPADKSCGECQAARESATLGGLAARSPDAGVAGCAAQIEYSARWANRLPAGIPLYPTARVTEAAGTEGGTCALRVVSFTVAEPMQNLLDWYYTKAVRAGYSAEHQVDGQEHILGGTRDRDDAAYVLFLNPRADGGTDVDLVANRGN